MTPKSVESCQIQGYAVRWSHKHVHGGRTHCGLTEKQATFFTWPGFSRANPRKKYGPCITSPKPIAPDSILLLNKIEILLSLAQ